MRYEKDSIPARDRLRRWKCKTIPASGWRQVRSEPNRGAAGIELQRKRTTPSRHARCSRLQWVNFVSDFVGDQQGDPTRWSILRTESCATAPVSHQKRHQRSATNTIELERNRSKINETDRYSAAHNGLVAGSNPAGPTNEINCLSGLIWPERDHRTRNRTRYVRFSFAAFRAW
jgi:hypothetical protein